MAASCTLVEHSIIFSHSDSSPIYLNDGSLGLSRGDFDAVLSWALANKIDGKSPLIPSWRSGYGQVLKASRFAGVIETKSGVVIEILPKIHANNLQQTRRVFLEMLRSTQDLPFESANETSLADATMPLLEIFVRLFALEVIKLTRSGLQSSYIPKEDNLKSVKGKIQIALQARINIAHRERIYCAFDEFSFNRMENRILKTTIEYLSKRRWSGSTSRLLHELSFFFTDAEILANPVQVFESLIPDRKTMVYRKSLAWCHIFLKAKSISATRGNTLALALLFDMNRLFECHVAVSLKRRYPDLCISAQKSIRHLMENPEAFRLRPDLMIGDTIIADTKWKLLDPAKPYDAISQGDLYQMYAYGKKHQGVHDLWLVYPDSLENRAAFGKKYTYENGLILTILGFDCITKELLGY